MHYIQKVSHLCFENTNGILHSHFPPPLSIILIGPELVGKSPETREILTKAGISLE